MRLVGLLLLVVQQLQALQYGAATSVVPAYSHETTLQADLLRGYNARVPPKMLADEATNIAVSLNVFKIADLNLEQSLLELHMWLRTSWRDPRLAWDPDLYGNVTQTAFNVRAGSLGDTDIWYPDLQLYNQAESINNLASAGAMVYSDGSVFFSRPGKLSVLCAFKGLDAFPFDSLSCDFELGGWARSGADVYYTLAEPALSQGGSATAQATYAQYGLVLEKSSVSISDFFYDCCPDEPWPIIKFRIYTTRATSYFAKTIIAPNIIFVLLSFAVFYLDVQCGERLGYGITLILAMVASDIIVGERLPVCNEWLWAEHFSGGSVLFATAALLESCVVTHLYYKANDAPKQHVVKSMLDKLAARLGWDSKRLGRGGSDGANDNIAVGVGDGTPELSVQLASDTKQVSDGSSSFLRSGSSTFGSSFRARATSAARSMSRKGTALDESKGPHTEVRMRVTTLKLLGKDTETQRTRAAIIIQTAVRRFLVTKRLARLRSEREHTRQQYLLERGQSVTQVELAQKLDLWSVTLFPLAYAIFVAYMASVAGNSGDEPQ